MTTPEKQPLKIPGLDMAKAKRYSHARLALLIAETGWTTARLAVFAFTGWSSRLRLRCEDVPHPVLPAPLFLAAVGAIGWGTAFPLRIISRQVERRFGLTEQPGLDWLRDQFKGLGLSLALQVPLEVIAFAVIRRRPQDWWLLVSAATVPLAILGSRLAPVLIMPLFNRFEPITDREMANRISALASRAGVPIADVYRMDMSRQSEKPNAFFTGLGGSKRIVLGDTLLDRFPSEEIESVVAHEVGHQVHGDMWRLITLGGGLGFWATYLLHRLALPIARRTSRRTGTDSIGDEASAPVLGLLMIGIGLGLTPIQLGVSRAIERRTDRYAVQLTGDGEAYASSMARLAAASLSDPGPPPLAVLLFYSHPPVAERIAAARAVANGPRSSVTSNRPSVMR